MNFFKKFTGKKSGNNEAENIKADNAVNDIADDVSEENEPSNNVLSGSEQTKNSFDEVQDKAEANNQQDMPEEAAKIILEAQNIAKDPNAQIRFVFEHKILPAKIIRDPVYVITT